MFRLDKGLGFTSKNTRKFIHSALSLILSLLLLLGSTATAQIEYNSLSAQDGGGAVSKRRTDEDVRVLEPGKPIEREMKGDELHSYEISLTEGQFIHLLVDQRGIDIVIKVFTPDGKQALEVNSRKDIPGPEAVLMITAASGDYRLELSAAEKNAPAGRYQASIVEARQATIKDSDRIAARIAAQKAFLEGEKLRGQRTAESVKKAVEKYKEALPLWRAAGDLNGEADTLYYLGRAYHELLGENQKALDCFNQALLLQRAAGDRYTEIYTLLNIGAVYDSFGEKQKALQSYNKVLLLQQATGDRYGEAYTLTNIGSIYAFIGEYEEALAYYNRALPLRRAVSDRYGEGQTLNSMGLAYYSQGEHEKALECFNLALPLYRAEGNRDGEAATLNNISLVYTALKEYQKALDNYQQVLVLAQAVGTRLGEAITLNNIGIVHALLLEHEKALECYNQALDLHKAVGNLSGEAITLYAIAVTNRDIGKFDESRAKMESALAIVESLRSKIGIRALRSSFFASKQDYYEFYIDLLMRMHKERPLEGYHALALHAVERARSRTLLEALAEAGVDIRENIDPKLRQQERSLREQLNSKVDYLQKAQSSGSASEQVKAAAEEIKKLELELHKVEAMIRETPPSNVARKYPEPLKLEQIQQQVLNADTLLLEYALGKDHSYLWAVTPESIDVYELPKRAEIERAVLLFYDLITGPQPGKRPFETDEQQRKREMRVRAATEYPKAAAELSRILLAPVTERLGKKRLVIVADGLLQYVPFEVLPILETSSVAPEVRTSRTGNRGRVRKAHSRRATPLLVEHEIVYLPSASTLAVQRQQATRREPARKTIALFTNPVFSKDDVRVKQSLAKVDAGSITNEKSDLRPGSSSQQDASNALGNKQAEQPAGEAGPKADAGNSSLKPLAKYMGGRSSLDQLPETERMGKRILALVPAGQGHLETGFDANLEKSTSPELKEYRIIQYATHGFLNPKPELSGLVLSLVDEKGRDREGFLSSSAIYNMNLSAELVVLSACQTGLALEPLDILGGEERRILSRVKDQGFTGLARGFVYAGAQRVMVGLWNVEVNATAELMERFYKELFSVKKPSAAAALRAAQVSMWKDPKWRHPYYWGAFVISGEYK